MTTLETNPIAFFFRPLSPTARAGSGAGVGAGTAALSIRSPLVPDATGTALSDGKPRPGASGECPKSTAVACTLCTSGALLA